MRPSNSYLTTENLEFGVYAFLMSSFFLPNKLNSICLVVLSLTSLWKFVKRKHVFKGYKELTLFPLLFVYLLTGILYSTNMKEGWAISERHLSLLIAPVLMAGTASLSKDQQERLLNVFLLTGLVVGVYCLGYATFQSIKLGTIYTTTQKGHFVYNSFMHQRLSAPVSLHAIYYSLYLSLANVIVLNKLLIGGLTNKKKNSYFALFIFFVILIFLLKSAVFAVVFPLACLGLFLKFFWSKLTSKTSKLILIGGSFALILFMCIGVKTKVESFSLSYALSDNHFTPITMRLAMWECSWEVIKQNMLFGTGTGDGEQELLKVYAQKGFNVGLKDKFNSHNMYLQYWLSNGLIALGIYLLLLLFLIKKAVRSRNSIFIVFVLFFAAFSVTESTMLVQKGIVFFAVFGSLFYWNPNWWNSFKEVK